MKQGIMTAISIFLMYAAVSAAVPDMTAHTLEVTVQENETIWDIAAKHCTDDQDIRQYIYDIRQLNHIRNSGDLQPGQILQIPVN